MEIQSPVNYVILKMKVNLILLVKNNDSDSFVVSGRKQFTFLFDESTSIKEILNLAERFWSVANLTVCIEGGQTHLTDIQLKNLLIKLYADFTETNAISLGFDKNDLADKTKSLNVYTYELQMDRKPGNMSTDKDGHELEQDQTKSEACRANRTYKRCPAIIMESIIKDLIKSISNYKNGEYTWKELSRNAKVLFCILCFFILIHTYIKY